MAISNAMSTSIISASSSMKMVRSQQSAKKQMDGKAGILQAEIKLDGGRGGDTKKKEGELKEVQDKASKIETSQMNTISEMNENMKQAAKEDQKEQEAARAAEEKRTEKKKAKKAAEKKQAEKKAQEERLEKDIKKNGITLTDEDAVEISEEDGTVRETVIGASVDVSVDNETTGSSETGLVGAKVDVQV